MPRTLAAGAVLAALLSILVAPPPLPAQEEPTQESGATQEAAPEDPPCSGPEHRQFDFWIGEWEVKSPEGELQGRNRIEKILDGCVLQENWTGASGSSGKSFNIYAPRRGQWHQTWVADQGYLLQLDGGLDEEGRMVLRGEAPGAEGGTVLHEVSWTPLPDGAVRQHWRASRDGGGTWEDVFVGIYRKSGS